MITKTQWVPNFLYWNLRLLSKKWEKPQGQVIEEALLEWMNKNKVNTQDYYLENPTELKKLISKYGSSKFKDSKFSLKGMDCRSIYLSKKTGQNLKIASLQTQRPSSGILTHAITEGLEALGWTFLSETTAKKECLSDYETELSGELLDSSESDKYQTDDRYDKLWNELDQKGLIKENQSYSYDDLLALKAESQENIQISQEAIDTIERIKKLTEKGDQNDSN